MTSLFRDFSFNPVSPPVYSSYEAERASMNISPSTTTVDAISPFCRPPTPPPCTMGDLAAQLNQQSLRLDTQVEPYTAGPITPLSDVCPSPTEEAPPVQPTYLRLSASILRMQRQSHSRMQCSSSHVRDVSKLVRMIEEQAQCTVTGGDSSCSSSRTSSTVSSCTSGDDEGVDMDYDRPARSIEALIGTTQWRAGDLRDGSVRVTKPVRMRKRGRQNGFCKSRTS